MPKHKVVPISQFCYDIGCSGTDPERCPGDPWCEIVRKAMRPQPEPQPELQYAVYDPGAMDG